MFSSNTNENQAKNTQQANHSGIIDNVLNDTKSNIKPVGFLKELYITFVDEGLWGANAK